MRMRRNAIKIVYDYLKARANSLSVKGIIIAIIKSSSHQMKPVDVFFWCHDNLRTTWFNGKRYAPLIDTIIEQIDGKVSHMTFAGPFSKFYGPSCYGNVVMYNRILLWAYIKRFIVQQSFTIKKSNNDAVVNAWKKILNKTTPKVIIGITPSPELCIAAKENLIWIADMQHGILAPGHFYDLKKRANISQQGWPDVILCWDQFSKDFIDANLMPYVSARVIGHPAFYSKANKGYIEMQDGDDAIENKITILVTLTWHIPLLYSNDPVFKAIGMPTALAEYIKIKGNFCRWHLRMHPAQAMKRKAEVFKELQNIFQGMDNVLWEECNNETLHDAFTKSTVHITFDSASAREAALLGINTAILDNNIDNANIYFGDLIKEGKAEIIDPSDHVLFTEWIFKSQSNYNNSKLLSTNGGKDRDRFEEFIADIPFYVIKSKAKHN